MTKITSPIKIALVTLLLAASQLIFPQVSRAQTAMGLTAIPPRLEVTVKPGGVVTAQIKVRNDSDTTRTITSTAKDFIVTDDKGTPIQIEGVEDQSNRWASSSWIEISPSTFTLKPKETKVLIVTIIAPDNPTAGGHYAMILHTPSNEVTLNETGSSIQTYVGTLVYITVPGNIKENAQITEFSAPSFLEFGPVDFKTVIANYSDIHISPKGNINIHNWLGGLTASLALDNNNIFPGTSRQFLNTLDRHFLFGRYTATLEAAYGTTGQALATTLVFWVIPWRLIILVLVAIAIGVILASLLRQKSSASKVAEDEKVEELEHELEDLKKKYQDRK
jgi:hypothetical protein